MKRRIFALVDCNNFFVSCERVFRPDLQQRPVVVLSNNDGCVVSRSNEAKALDIPMGAPWFMYKDLFARQGVEVFSGNFGLYREFSRRVQQIIRDSSNDFEAYSIDESFVEMSSYGITDYKQWGLDLRAKILAWTGIPVSVGIAPTKTLAKIGAWHAKKDPRSGGVFDLSSVVEGTPEWRKVLEKVPVGDVWGVGWRMNKKLLAQRIETAYALVTQPDLWQKRTFNIIGRRTIRELHGEPSFMLAEDVRGYQKSVSVTRSFAHAIEKLDDLEAAVSTFATQGTKQLREKGEVAGGILVFVRGQGGYTTGTPAYKASVSLSLGRFTDDTLIVVSQAISGLRGLYKAHTGYKRAGVILYNLVPKAAEQVFLSDTLDVVHFLEGRDALMAGIDELADRYGRNTVQMGSEMLSGEWHSAKNHMSPYTMLDWGHIPVVKV